MGILIDLEGMAAEAFGMDAKGSTPLDGDVIWYRYETQRDLRVRPSHAAFQGTVWRADDPAAPTPPCDYGCRCFLVPIASPDQPALAKVMPTTDVRPITVQQAFAGHLDAILPAWGDILAAIKKRPVIARAEAAYAAVSAADPKLTAADARDIARMICVVANG